MPFDVMTTPPSTEPVLWLTTGGGGVEFDINKNWDTNLRCIGVRRRICASGSRREWAGCAVLVWGSSCAHRGDKRSY